MSEYIFPILSIEDLITSMPFVTEADFKKPEPARWYKIYGMVFESLTEEKAENGEEKAMVLFPKYCKAEHPEIYEDASCVLWFTLVLQQLFFSCGINDFTFKDIRDPRPKRCTVLCSAVVNFIRFKANREPVIEAVLEKVERYKIQYEEVTKTNTELKNRISVEMSQYEEREGRIQQLQELLNTANDNMMAIQTESQGLLSKISEKKMLISEARARQDELKCEKMKISQECEKLQRNIVQSPQKLKAKLSGMQEKVEQLKQTKAEKMELMSSRRNQVEQLKTHHGIVERGIHFMQSMQEDLDSRKTAEEEIKSIKESRQVNIHKSKGIKRQEEEVVESISLIQDRIQKLLLQKRTRATDLDACFSQTTEKKKETTVKLDTLKAEKETLQREKETWLRKIESLQTKCNEKTDIIIEQYTNILKSVNQYHLMLQERILSASA